MGEDPVVTQIDRLAEHVDPHDHHDQPGPTEEPGDKRQQRDEMQPHDRKCIFPTNPIGDRGFRRGEPDRLFLNDGLSGHLSSEDVRGPLDHGTADRVANATVGLNSNGCDAIFDNDRAYHPLDDVGHARNRLVPLLISLDTFMASESETRDRVRMIRGKPPDIESRMQIPVQYRPPATSRQPRRCGPSLGRYRMRLRTEFSRAPEEHPSCPVPPPAIHIARPSSPRS